MTEQTRTHIEVDTLAEALDQFEAWARQLSAAIISGADARRTEECRAGMKHWRFEILNWMK